MPSIIIKENESFDYALRRFKRMCERAGVVAEARRRKCYEKPATVRKHKAIAAKKRQHRLTMRSRVRRQRRY